MPALLAEYPEFFIAIALLLAALVFGSRTNNGFHAPLWLANPAKEFLQKLPVRYTAWLQAALVKANWRNNQSLGDFACLKLVAVVVAALAAAIVPPLYAVLLITLSLVLPELFLLLVIRRRTAHILLSLPQAIDLMVLCADAGLSLDATLQRIARDNHGVQDELKEELNILNRDILLGMEKERAYQELYARTGIEELRSLGSALHQGSKLGLSVGKILRNQSELIRKKQSQRAEEKSMRLPILMVFPMWFCIMPALLLIVLGPSLLNFFAQMPFKQ